MTIFSFIKKEKVNILPSNHPFFQMALIGNTVLFERNDKITKGILTSFDGKKYKVKVGKKWKSVVLPLDDDDWKPVKNTCCICLDRPAMIMKECGCKAPWLCLDCSLDVTSCPMCRDPVTEKGNYFRILDKTTDHMITLFIESLTKRRWEFKVSLDWKVGTISSLLHTELKLKHDCMRFVYKGKGIADCRSLRDYGVEDGATIFMIKNLRGD